MKDVIGGVWKMRLCYERGALNAATGERYHQFSLRDVYYDADGEIRDWSPALKMIDDDIDELVFTLEQAYSVVQTAKEDMDVGIIDLNIAKQRLKALEAKKK